MLNLENKVILYLYAEVMGYTISTIEELCKLGYEIHVLHWDKKKLSNSPTSYPSASKKL